MYGISHILLRGGIELTVEIVGEYARRDRSNKGHRCLLFRRVVKVSYAYVTLIQFVIHMVVVSNVPQTFL